MGLKESLSVYLPFSLHLDLDLDLYLHLYLSLSARSSSVVITQPAAMGEPWFVFPVLVIGVGLPPTNFSVAVFPETSHILESHQYIYYGVSLRQVADILK
jgi:hypothetical protein